MAQHKGNTGPKARMSGTVTVDLASIAANVGVLVNVTIADVIPGDTILFSEPSGGLSVRVALGVGFCTTAGTAVMPVINPSVAALDAASAVLDFQILRKVGL